MGSVRLGSINNNNNNNGELVHGIVVIVKRKDNVNIMIFISYSNTIFIKIIFSIFQIYTQADNLINVNVKKYQRMLLLTLRKPKTNLRRE